MNQDRSDRIHRAHEVLEEYYRARADRGDEAAEVQAIYHASRVDPARAADEWVRLFDRAAANKRDSLCGLLVDTRPLLKSDSPVALTAILEREARYLKETGHPEASRATYEFAVGELVKVLGRDPTNSPAASELVRLRSVLTGFAPTTDAD